MTDDEPKIEEAARKLERSLMVLLVGVVLGCVFVLAGNSQPFANILAIFGWGPWSDEGKQTILVTIGTIATAVFSALVVMLTNALHDEAIRARKANHRIIEANEKLTNLALEQHKRDQADFRVADPKRLRDGTLFFSITNMGGRDSAIVWCRLWPFGYETDGFPQELELFEPQYIHYTGGKARPTEIHRGQVTTDFMIRSGDRRGFVARIKGDGDVTFEDDRATLDIAPAVGERLLQTISLGTARGFIRADREGD